MAFQKIFRKTFGFFSKEQVIAVLKVCLHITAGRFGRQAPEPVHLIALEKVMDMIETKFMEFPVFNVADCFICCGCVLLMVHLLIWNKELWKEEKK